MSHITKKFELVVACDPSLSPYTLSAWSEINPSTIQAAQDGDIMEYFSSFPDDVQIELRHIPLFPCTGYISIRRKQRAVGDVLIEAIILELVRNS